MNHVKKRYLFFTLASFMIFLPQASPRISNVTASDGVVIAGAAAAVGVAGPVSDNSVFRTNVFDPATSTMYMGYKTLGNAPTNATGTQSLMSAKLSGSSIVTTHLAAATLANNFRNLVLHKGGLVLSQEAHGTDGFGAGNTAATSASLWWVNPAVPGTPVALALQDSAPADGRIDRVAASADHIFALVLKPGAATSMLNVDATHRLRVVTLNEVKDTLAPVGVGKLGASGPELTFSANNGTNNLETMLGSTGYDVRSVTAMHWDENLEKLFVGFNTSDGGTAAGSNRRFIMVGSMNGNDVEFREIVLNTAIGGLSATFNIATASGAEIHGIVGMKAPTAISSAASQRFKVNHIKTMKTSTAKNYLITQVRPGDIDTLTIAKKVFAVPLYAGATAADVGKVATKDMSTAVTVAADLYGPNDLPALVGGAALPAVSASLITDLQVCGDTVYACVVGDADAKTEHFSGVYSSTAIFGATGIIAAWSPWTRVVASAENKGVADGTVQTTPANASIYSLGINPATNDVHFVYGNQAGAVVNGVGVTAWGSGDAQAYKFGSKNLATKINSDFSGSAGVYGGAHFPAIKTAGLGSSDLNVLLGYGKVALFSTGGILSNATYLHAAGKDLRDQAELASSNRPYATVAYRDADYGVEGLTKRYKSFSELDGITFPYCAEVARSTNNIAAADSSLLTDQGFLFVGGDTGVSVLRNAAGAGWNSHNGDHTDANKTMGATLEDIGTNLAAFSFKKLPGIDESVHDMVSTGEYLYVMTAKKLYRIRLHSLGAAADQADMLAQPIMFDNANLADATKTINASGVALGSITAGTGVTSGKYNKDYYVYQLIHTLGAGEHFAQLAGIPNSGVIFAATNLTTAVGYNIYAIRDANVADPATVTAHFSTADDKVSSTTDSFRRMNVMMANTANATLVLVAGVAIANLNVLTGSIYANSKLQRYPVIGTITVAGMNATTHYRYPAVTLDAAADWKGAVTNVMDLGLLANGIAMEGCPTVFASSNASAAGSEDHALRLNLAAKTSQASATQSGSRTDARGLIPLTSGAHMLFGGFGARIEE